MSHLLTCILKQFRSYICREIQDNNFDDVTNSTLGGAVTSSKYWSKNPRTYTTEMYFDLFYFGKLEQLGMFHI